MGEGEPLVEIKVYLDQPLLGGFISGFQDATLLWIVGQINAIKVKPYRLILGGAIGGFFQFLICLNIASKGLINNWVWSPVIFTIIIPLLMVGLSFVPLGIRKYFRTLGYMYLLSFLLAGFHWGFDIINRQFFQWELTIWWRFILHLSLIFIMGELGWGVVHRKFWEQICLYPIQITWGTSILNLNALLDTGNRLHDPLTRLPVIIVELKKVKAQLPVEFIDWIEKVQLGELVENIKLPNYWEERVRVLPFHSIGKEHGILVGFRSDEVKVWEKKQTVINENVIIGLYHKSLSKEGAFHALIPPTVLSK